MTTTFHARDDQFAIATGTNVNDGYGRSTFDYPPDASHDLIVTSNPGDPEPYRFDIGDTYDLGFSGAGGTTLEDARVIRSDDVSGGGSVVVFEGTNPAGDVVQVVWSPGFNLDAWIEQSHAYGYSPGFYTTDQNANATYQAVCFAAATRIGTATGDVPAGNLGPGDRVLTADRGPVPVRWVGRFEVAGCGKHAPVRFAAGSFGNDRPLLVSQHHRLVLAGPTVELLHGACQVLVPAKALVNGGTIRVHPVAQITYVHVLTDDHDIVRAEGAPAETLLLGDVANAVLGADRSAIARLVPKAAHLRAARPILRFGDAARLWRLMTASGQRPPPGAVLHPTLPQ